MVLYPLNKRIFLLLGLVLIGAANSASADVGVASSASGSIDSRPPEVTVLTPAANELYLGLEQVPFSWQVTDTNHGPQSDQHSATVLIDDVGAFDYPFSLGSPLYEWNWTVPDLSPSLGQLQVTAYDAFGNATIGLGNRFTILPAGSPVASDLPDVLRLGPARPNPFNPQTTLHLELPRTGHVALDVFDLRGHRVRTLIRGQRTAGPLDVVWDGRDDRQRSLPGGTYLISLVFGQGRERVVRTQKAVLLP